MNKQSELKDDIVEQTMEQTRVNKRNYYSWKWSTGTPYKKSERIQKQAKTQSDITSVATNPLTEIDLFINSIPNITIHNDVKHSSNKREKQNEKLSNRDLIIQTSINPFISSQNYIDDIHNEDEFLRPKDSNNNE